MTGGSQLPDRSEMSGGEHCWLHWFNKESCYSMKMNKYFGGMAGAAAAIVVGSLLGAAPASAADDTLGAVTNATPSTANNAAAVATSTSGDTAIDATIAGADVSVPVDASQGISVTTEAGSIALSLPYSESADSAVAQKSGVVSYDNNNGSTSVPVLTKDGSLQVNTVIADPAAPKRYSYDITLPEGGQIAQAGDGYFILNAQRDPVAYVAAPWAKDANGAAVPTHYELSGNTLTQVVDFTAQSAFPVVADPSVTWLWWGRTIKYSKSETQQVANFASAAQMFSYLCIAGGLVGAACTTAANLGLQIVKNAATNALKAGRCIQLNIPYVGPGLIYDVKC